MIPLKVIFAGLWLVFAIYAFGFAPPSRPDTLELITKLSTGNWDCINWLIICLFNLMGIFPLIYASVILIDGRGQKIAAWPFVVASFAVGAFAILPYLAFRKPNPNFTGEKNLLVKVLDSRITGVAITIGTLALLGLGLWKGDWADFFTQWQTSRFINVMTLDFCCLCLLFPALLGDDMARRGINNPRVFWTVALIPLLGPCFYLCTRKPLPDLNTSKTQVSV